MFGFDRDKYLFLGSSRGQCKPLALNASHLPNLLAHHLFSPNLVLNNIPSILSPHQTISPDPTTVLTIAFSLGAGLRTIVLHVRLGVGGLACIVVMTSRCVHP